MADSGFGVRGPVWKRALGTVCMSAMEPRTRATVWVGPGQAAVFRVPLWARSAHVVEIGAIRAFAAEASTPQPAQRLGKIVPHTGLRTLPTEGRPSQEPALKRMY